MAPSWLPDISEEDIKDKSKADGLTKTIVCIQATWFIVQCIVRLTTTGSSISLLELNTFAHAICALLIYGLWWDKPFDVEEPIRITHPEIHDLCAYLCFFQEFDGACDDKLVSIPYRADLIRKAQSYAPNVDASSSEGVSRALRTGCVQELSRLGPVSEDRARWLTYIPGAMAQPRKGFLAPGYMTRARERWNRACLCTLAFNDLEGAVAPPWYATVKDRQGNFPVDIGHGALEGPFLFGFTLAGLFYGGLHLVAWNAPFTSQTQRLLWEVSGLAVASSGPAILIVAATDSVLPKLRKIRRRANISVTLKTFFDRVADIAFNGAFIVIVAGAALYVLARIYLVVESFISFAYLPESAFNQPRWVGYFPHIQ